MATIKKSDTVSSQERNWEIESAMNTITRYNDIIKNKDLMRDVQKKAKEQLNTVMKAGGVVPKTPSKKVSSKKPTTKMKSKKK